MVGRWFANIFPSLYQLFFHAWSFSLLGKSFWFWYNLICLVWSKKLPPTPMLWSVSPMFSSKNFIVSDLKFRSLIHHELILYVVRGMDLISFFYIYTSSFAITICMVTLLYRLSNFIKSQLVVCMWVNFWGPFFLFLWSMWQFLCQYRAVLITITL